MSERDDREPARQGTVGQSRAKIIAAAQERCYRAVTTFIESATTSDGQPDRAAVELHNAVIAFYRALRPLRGEPAVADDWEGVEWQTREGEHTGLAALETMMIRYKETNRKRTGFLGTQQQTRRVPVRLPPQTLLNLAAELDDMAVALGFAPEVAEGSGREAVGKYADILEEGPP